MLHRAREFALKEQKVRAASLPAARLSIQAVEPNALALTVRRPAAASFGQQTSLVSTHGISTSKYVRSSKATADPGKSVQAALTLAELSLNKQATNRLNTVDEHVRLEIYNRAIRDATNAEAVVSLVKAYAAEYEDRRLGWQPGTFPSLPPAKPLSIAVQRLSALGNIREAVRLIKWAWRIEGTARSRNRPGAADAGSGSGAAETPKFDQSAVPRLDVHPSVLTALFVELARGPSTTVPAAAGAGASTGSATATAADDMPAQARADAAAQLLTWVIDHTDAGVRLWNACVEEPEARPETLDGGNGSAGRSSSGAGAPPPRKAVPILSTVQGDGYVPIGTYNAAIRVWANHGLPSPSYTDSLGWRGQLLRGHERWSTPGAPNRTNSTDRRLDRALQLAHEERRMRADAQAAGSMPPSSTQLAPLSEAAYLWQVRGGLWLPERGAITPPLSFATVTAAQLTDTGLSAVETRPVSADTVSSSLAWALKSAEQKRATLQAMTHGKDKASKEGAAAGSSSSPSSVPSEEELVHLGPSGYSPLIDLPQGATQSLRLAAAVLRRVTGLVLHPNGVAQPHRHSNMDARANPETLASLFALCANAVDVLAVGRMAVHLNVQLYMGPGLALGVARAVELGGIAEAHALIELAQEQHNAAHAAEYDAAVLAKERAAPGTGLESAPLPQLRAIATEMGDIKAWITEQQQRDVELGDLLWKLEDLGHASGMRLPVLRRLQHVAATTRALPMALPSLSAEPLATISDAYCALIKTAVGSGALVQAMAAWDSALQAQAVVSLPTVRAVVKAATELGLPIDVYRMAGWMESARGFVTTGGNASSGVPEAVAPLVRALDPTVEHAGGPVDPARHFARLAGLYTAATAAARQPSPEATGALHRAISAVVDAPLPFDRRAALNARQAPGSDAAHFAGVQCLDPSAADAAINGKDMLPVWASTVNSANSGSGSLAGLCRVDASVLVTALDAVAGLGDGDAAAAIALRELGRVALLQAAAASSGQTSSSPAAAMSTQVARAAVRGLAVCGDLRTAVAAARAFMFAGTRLEETDLLTIVLSVLHPEDTEHAFAALELMSSTGVEPTAATERALATMTATLARRGTPVPEALVEASKQAAQAEAASAGRNAKADSLRSKLDKYKSGNTAGTGATDGKGSQQAGAGPGQHANQLAPVNSGVSIVQDPADILAGTASETTLLLRAVTALSDAGLSKAVLQGLGEDGGEEAAAGAEGSSGRKGSASSPSVHKDSPLTEAARTARVLSTAVIRWTVEQMRLVALSNQEALRQMAGRDGAAGASASSASPAPPSAGEPALASSDASASNQSTHMGTGHFTSLGPEDVEDAIRDDDLTFLAAAREMLLLAVKEWPVSSAVARARQDLDVASVRRARVALVRRHHEAKLSTDSPLASGATDGIPWTRYGELLRHSASWAEYMASVRAVRGSPPLADVAAARARHGGRLQVLPEAAWGPTLFWRAAARDINPDEDGTGLYGVKPVFGRDAAAALLGTGRAHGMDNRGLSFEEAKELAGRLLVNVLTPKSTSMGAKKDDQGTDETAQSVSVPSLPTMTGQFRTEELLTAAGRVWRANAKGSSSTTSEAGAATATEKAGEAAAAPATDASAGISADAPAKAGEAKAKDTAKKVRDRASPAEIWAQSASEPPAAVLLAVAAKTAQGGPQQTKLALNRVTRALMKAADRLRKGEPGPIKALAANTTEHEHEDAAGSDAVPSDASRSSLREVKERLASAIRAGLRGSVVLGGVLSSDVTVPVAEAKAASRAQIVAAGTKTDGVAAQPAAGATETASAVNSAMASITERARILALERARVERQSARYRAYQARAADKKATAIRERRAAGTDTSGSPKATAPTGAKPSGNPRPSRAQDKATAGASTAAAAGAQ